MNSRLLILLSGVLAIVSAWLPWVKMGELTQNGFMGEYRGNPGLFFVVLGALIAIMGLINKKWSAIIAMLFALCVGGLGFKYYHDATSGDAATLGVSAGYGIYAMMLAALVGLLGGIMGMKSKGGAAATAA